jgi:hypothetical protein
VFGKEAEAVNQRPSHAARRRQSVWLLLGLLAGIGAVRLAAQWGWLVPVCGFRALTGLPCPLCGGTRSLLAWSRLDFASALASNPLLFVVCAGLGVGAGLGFAGFGGWSPLAARARACLRQRWAKAALAAALALNWLYLLIQSGH